MGGFSETAIEGRKFDKRSIAVITKTKGKGVNFLTERPPDEMSRIT